MSPANRVSTNITIRDTEKISVSRTKDGEIHICFVDTALSIFTTKQLFDEIDQKVRKLFR